MTPPLPRSLNAACAMWRGGSIIWSNAFQIAIASYVRRLDSANAIRSPSWTTEPAASERIALTVGVEVESFEAQPFVACRREKRPG
jgi:hypothetical protein